MPRVATATSSQIAADAAAAVAALGGNAIDCAIAAALVTINTEPGVCALAGGAYVMVWPAGGDPVLIDGNVAVPGIGAGDGTPDVAVIDMEYGGGVRTLAGAGSVAVPGTPAALERASSDYGFLPWRELVAPSIALARDGFPISSACHYYLQYSGKPIFGRSDDGFGALHEANGTLRPAGSKVVVPHLADSLDCIAREGSRALYEGALADALVAHIGNAGGRLTREDLERYEAKVRKPLMTTLGDWQLACNPPPAVGGTVLAAMLGAFRHRAATQWDDATLARLVATQLAVLNYRRERLDLADDIGAESAALLQQVSAQDFPPGWVSGSTVHTSAVDDRGNACAITASAGYGSGEMPPGTGLWLNNCLGELELNRRGLDAGPPGRRLPSNMSPGAARRGHAVMAFGSPGADRITTALQQFLLNALQQDLPLEAAIAAPRVHVEVGESPRVAVEPPLKLPDGALPVRTYPGLNMYFGGVAAARYDPDRGFEVGADPRRAGGTCIAGTA